MVGVSRGSSQIHSSPVLYTHPKPSPRLRGLTKERGAWPDPKEAHLGGGQEARALETGAKPATL